MNALVKAQEEEANRTRPRPLSELLTANDRDEIENLGLRIVTALATDATYTYIDLREECLHEEGGILLADALRHNSTIKFLNLQHTNMGDDGIVAVAEALGVNRSVETAL